MTAPALYDNHNRRIDYLRLAVTDRCNLRCFYCMPEEGIDYVPRPNLMSFEEIRRTVGVLTAMGIRKLRITGGEPFLRKDLPELLTLFQTLPQAPEVHLTTNGTTCRSLIPQFAAWGIKSVNLSLDSLDRARFRAITRRDWLPEVMATYQALLTARIPVKINCVVMQGHNEADLLPLARLASHDPVTVRFIEEMPFNGNGKGYAEWRWDYRQIEAHLRAAFPSLQRLPGALGATATNYRVDGFRGELGIIAAYSRTFCGTCNRLRLTPTGLLKTCLYDQGVFNLRDLLRGGATDAELRTALQEALQHRAVDGHAAEAASRIGPVGESMATIGG